MFLDPFIFTPPRPDALTRAVESYQRVAATRFSRYARDAEDPDLLPRKVRGDLLEPTPKQLHGEVRALRHLTAIQRTLRDIGGPLFNPDSPIPPRERFRLVERRLDAIEEALGELDAECPDASLDSHESCESYTSHMSDSSDSSDPSASSHLVNPVNHVDSLPAPPGDFELHRPRPGDDFYHPPEIEDLLEAVDFAQRVFAARAELLDKRRLELSPEDFLLEIASLRDLTAVIRTLRRMSAHRLPEDEPISDSLGLRSEEASQRIVSCPQDGSASSDADAPCPAATPEPAPSLHPSSHPAHGTHTSHNSSESVQSVKSAGGSASAPPENNSPARNASSARASSGRAPGLIDSLAGDRPLRSVPRVPEVRRINNPVNGSSPAPNDPSGEAEPGRGATPVRFPSRPCHPSSDAQVSSNHAPDPVRESPCSSVSVRAFAHAETPAAGASAEDGPPASFPIPNPKSQIRNSTAPPVLRDKDPPSRNSP